ncbi:MAG: enoyl-CoA hydratase/isomerase family protein [Smithellaceae bacterium]
METNTRDVVCSRLELSTKGCFMGMVMLNRPEEMNPLNWSTIKEIRAVMTELSRDPAVRVIAVTGSGKAFCAGGDLKKYLTLMQDEVDLWAYSEDMHALFNYIYFDIPKPVIALVNGVAAAGGTEMLLACDFAYAAESARIGDAHLNFGQMGGGGALTRLPRVILPNQAREMMFTAKFYTAAECFRLGLVNRVVPDGELIKAGLEFANIVATKSPLAVKNMRQVSNKGLTMRLEDSLALESRVAFHYCRTSFDSREGLEAFAEKRKPKFKGQ